MIKSFDNVLDEDVSLSLEKDITSLKWKSGWESGATARGRKDWHWHYGFFQDSRNCPTPTPEHLKELYSRYPRVMHLWGQIQARLMAVTGYKCDFVRAYSNAHTHGIDGLIHRDDGDYTAIYYPCSNWDVEWEGGTCFYNEEKNDVIAYSAYRHNRLVIFNADIPHRAMPITRDCYRLRAVIVFKCMIDVNHSSYARQYYIDNQKKV